MNIHPLLIPPTSDSLSQFDLSYAGGENKGLTFLRHTDRTRQNVNLLLVKY